MARLGLLIWRGCVKERLLKILLLLWTAFLFQGQELLCESLMPLSVPWFPVLCPAVSWGWGYSEYITSFQEQLGSLFSIPILVREWYLCTSMGLRGSQECSLNSCAWNNVAILVGSPPLSLSNPCCSSLFPTHAQSTCFTFSL